MIMYKDFVSVEELRQYLVEKGNIQIINIESMKYEDVPRYYYRLWFVVGVGNEDRS